MHIVDISALYSPQGGGIRTYTHRKLAKAEQLDLKLTVIVPGAADAVQRFGPARLVSIKSPRFPLDRNYFYFKDVNTIHRALDREQPDLVECSSPWGSAGAVAAWPGAAPRVLVMHAEPMSAWVYRHLDRFMKRKTIDRSFDWFWRYLRRLDARYDMVVTAAPSVAARLRAGGLQRVAVHPMGVDAGVFSPALRDTALRARLLARCGLPESATLLLGVGRLSPEKQWPVVIDAVTAAGVGQPLGLVILGDGHGRAVVVRALGGNPHIQLIAPLTQRFDYAQLLASVDAMVHGGAAETFGLACAEGRASGLPLIVPDQGGAYDQLMPGMGLSFVAGDAGSLASAIAQLPTRLPAMREAAASGAFGVSTMDEHFDGLFAAYRTLLEWQQGRLQQDWRQQNWEGALKTA